MENRNFYNEILTEHNMHPDFKHDIEDADIVLDGINPSCGDEIQLKLKLMVISLRTGLLLVTAVQYLRLQRI